MNKALWLASLMLVLMSCQHWSGKRSNTFDARASYAQGVPTRGLCLGLPAVHVLHRSNKVRCIALIDDQLVFPRGVVGLGDQLLVVDKGSDLFSAVKGIGAGRVYAYRQSASKQTGRHYEKRLLIDKLDHPSGIGTWQRGAQRYVFISTRSALWRFDPDATVPARTLTAVLPNLPTRGWHYLTQIHIHADNLYVSIPSATDHCEDDHVHATAVQYPCRENGSEYADELSTAALRHYKILPDGSLGTDFSLLAMGLRNAAAITTDPQTQRLWVTDNAWDQIDLTNPAYGVDAATYPHDELNLLALPTHFGWPYCFSDNRVNPLYASTNVSCNNYQAPLKLLPAHSAPMGMTYRSRRLLLNLHGFQPSGRRTVYFDLDETGLPIDNAHTLIDWNFEHTGDHYFGRPFGITTHGKNLLAITDDWNHALMVVVLN